MILYVKESSFKGKGLKSFFKSVKFTMEIITETVTKLNLTASEKNIGLFLRTKEEKIVIKFLIQKEEIYKIYLDLNDIPYLTKEKKGIEMDNNFFTGELFIYRMKYDGFTDLENTFLSENVSFLTESTNTGRMSYDGINYTTANNLFILSDVEYVPLPFGFERTFFNDQMYFIDHNAKVVRKYCYVQRAQNYSAFVKIHLYVDRNAVIKTCSKVILKIKDKIRRSELVPHFRNEIGDGIGVKKEFFRLIGEELKKEKRLKNEDGFYNLNIDYDWKEDDDSFLEFLGLIIGASMINCCSLEINFSLVFLEAITDKDFKIETIQNNSTQRSFLQIHRGNISFDQAVDLFCLSKTEVYFLEQSKDKLITHLILKMFYEPHKRRYEIIAKAFDLCLYEKISSYDLFYKMFASTVTWEELFKYMCYVNCTSQTKEVQFLMEILKDDLLRIKFVIFSTGESSLIDDSITIEQIKEKNMYFNALTCTKRARIGLYDDKETMLKYLIESVEYKAFHIV